MGVGLTGIGHSNMNYNMVVVRGDVLRRPLTCMYIFHNGAYVGTVYSFSV